jgi:hypothetical protein
MISEFPGPLSSCRLEFLWVEVANVGPLPSTLISLNCPTGMAEKFIQSVNEAAEIMRNLSLAR